MSDELKSLGCVRARTTRIRLFGRCIAALVLVGSVCVLAAALVASDPAGTPEPEAVDAKALTVMMQSFDNVEVAEYPWGWIRWMMSDKLDPGSQMTFGLVEVNAGQDSPAHMHPNCEEHLYVLSGSCRHRVGDHSVVMKKGDLLRIPTGVPHSAKVLGDKPFKAVIVYSDGNRQFVPLDVKKSE